MLTWAIMLSGGGALSFGLAMLTGKFIATGMGTDEASEPVELTCAQLAYDDAVARGDTRAMRAALQDLYREKHAQLAGEMAGKR